MSLPKSEISEILSAMGDILTRLIDRVEKNIEFQPFERRELLNTLYKQMCGIQIDEILTRADNKHKLQIKRGDTDKNDIYIGQPGEITMDTDTRTIRVHDGETTGGIALAKYDELPNPQDIILATIPDYTNGTECVFLSETTAPENGYFEVTGTAFNNTYLNIKLNDVPKKIATSTNNTFSTTGFVLFPVKQGDKIQGISSYNNTGKITFYPMCK
ncbi:MAG: hypothetical protein IJD52_04580 [Alphaproteobacteria bacterium]|nr:hypothetical protein [Alphaproteobacteria bacterium]